MAAARKKAAEATPTRTRAKRRGPKPTDWTPTFLAKFEELFTVTAACEAAGIERSTAYRRRHSDEDFALAWADIEEKTTEMMEQEAIRRATDGINEPIFHKGEIVATVRRPSDRLLIFMLGARNPEKYRERMDIRHSGRVERPPVSGGGLDLSKLGKDEIDMLERLHEKAAKTEED
jgi:hypothetical protein